MLYQNSIIAKKNPKNKPKKMFNWEFVPWDVSYNLLLQIPVQMTVAVYCKTVAKLVFYSVT